jgi:hypothetical protein
VIRALNEAVHVYREDLARRLAGALPGYLAAFRELAAAAARELGVCNPGMSRVYFFTYFLTAFGPTSAP